MGGTSLGTVTLAYIGFGSNLGDRERAILASAELLGVTRLSAIRETEPWGSPISRRS